MLNYQMVMWFSPTHWRRSFAQRCGLGPTTKCWGAWRFFKLGQRRVCKLENGHRKVDLPMKHDDLWRFSEFCHSDINVYQKISWVGHGFTSIIWQERSGKIRYSMGINVSAPVQREHQQLINSVAHHPTQCQHQTNRPWAAEFYLWVPFCYILFMFRIRVSFGSRQLMNQGIEVTGTRGWWNWSN